ncbi:MAG: hypothetical protein ACOZNI_21055 [Myxococcota bacterium]
MNWKWAVGITAGLFGAGVAVGYVAHKRGIPQDEIGRWLVKGATRRALRLYDSVRDVLPDEAPVPLARAIEEAPPRPEGL